MYGFAVTEIVVEKYFLPKEMRDGFPTLMLKVNYHKLQIGSALPKSLQSNLKKA